MGCPFAGVHLRVGKGFPDPVPVEPCHRVGGVVKLMTTDDVVPRGQHRHVAGAARGLGHLLEAVGVALEEEGSEGKSRASTLAAPPAISPATTHKRTRRKPGWFPVWSMDGCMLPERRGENPERRFATIFPVRPSVNAGWRRAVKRYRINRLARDISPRRFRGTGREFPPFRRTGAPRRAGPGIPRSPDAKWPGGCAGFAPLRR